MLRHHFDNTGGNGHLGLHAPGRCDLEQLRNLLFHTLAGGRPQGWASEFRCGRSLQECTRSGLSSFADTMLIKDIWGSIGHAGLV